LIRYLSDNLIRLVAPINTEPDPHTVISSGTCTARLFDEDHETELSADEATSQTVLSVDRARSIEVGSDVTVMLDDGTYHDAGTVTARDLDADEVTVTTGLASAASAGARVLTSIGADVTLTTYGTPGLLTTDWGFKGTMLHNHADVKPGMQLRIEIFLDASGVELLETIREPVVVGN